MTASDFTAGLNQAGCLCYICDEPVQMDELVRYYGGPFMMHVDCINKAIDPHWSKEKESA